MIHNRDPLFTTEFLEMLADVGVKATASMRTRKDSCEPSKNPT
jgi:hypothetical protein